MSSGPMCVTCNVGTLCAAKIETSIEVAGHRFTAMVSGLKCDSCGDDQIGGPETQAFEHEVARALASSEPVGEAVRFIRKALGFSGEALGALLGVRFETISRWERGLHPIDRQAWTLMGLLVTDREHVEAALRAAAEPTTLPAEIEVNLA